MALKENRRWKPLHEAALTVARRRGVLLGQAWAMLKMDIASGEIPARCRARRFDRQQRHWIETWRDLASSWLGSVVYECLQDNYLRFDQKNAARARLLGEQLDLPPEHAREIAVGAARLDELYPPGPEEEPSVSALGRAEAATIAAASRAPRKNPSPPASERTQEDLPSEASIENLAEWIFGRHDTGRSYEKLYAAVTSDPKIGAFRRADFLAAYQRVYITKPHRPPATGWPLRSPYREQWSEMCRKKS